MNGLTASFESDTVVASEEPLLGCEVVVALPDLHLDTISRGYTG
jgi:hypothetical protein